MKLKPIAEILRLTKEGVDKVLAPAFSTSNIPRRITRLRLPSVARSNTKRYWLNCSPHENPRREARSRHRVPAVD